MKKLLILVVLGLVMVGGIVVAECPPDYDCSSPDGCAGWERCGSSETIWVCQYIGAPEFRYDWVEEDCPEITPFCVNDACVECTEDSHCEGDYPSICCLNFCDNNGVFGENFDDECRTGPSCIGQGNWGYEIARNGESCSDDLYCTVNDQCSEGLCLSGTPRDCSDGDPCTSDSCSEGLDECIHTYNPSLPGCELPEFSTIGILLALLIVTVVLGIFIYKRKK